MVFLSNVLSVLVSLDKQPTKQKHLNKAFNTMSISLKWYTQSKNVCTWINRTTQTNKTFYFLSQFLAIPNQSTDWSGFQIYHNSRIIKVNYVEIIKKIYMLVILRWAHSWIFMPLPLSSDSLCVWVLIKNGAEAWNL